MKCHNDPKKYYKGDEPSPKGRGYCASTEVVGKRMIGNDGKKWIVAKVKNGKRWMRVSTGKNSPARKNSPRMIINYEIDRFLDRIEQECPGKINQSDLHVKTRGTIRVIITNNLEDKFVDILKTNGCDLEKAMKTLTGISEQNPDEDYHEQTRRQLKWVGR